MSNKYFSENTIALEQQIRNILSTLDNVTETTDYYNFRCSICGDSKKSKYKKRAYILMDKTPFMYYCHNCFYKKPVYMWMKEFYPAHYKDYISEMLRLNDNKQEVKPIVFKQLKPKSDEQNNTKFFIPILKGSNNLFEKAIKFCKSRNISEDIWSKWYVAVDGMYKNRLIIPFVDNKGKVYYYQGRRLDDRMEPKYLSRAGSNHNNIYNYYLVDPNKPVIVLEGSIDSLFVDNSVAVTGVKMNDPKLSIFKQKYFIIDNDSTPETPKKIIELLEQGNYVFCWNKFKKEYKLPKRDKWDINDVILYLKKDKYNYDELAPFFTNSIYDKVFFI
jgi:hypothetical protein